MRVSALFATASCLAGYASAIALWPIPKSLSTGNDTVWLTPDVQFFFNFAQTNGAQAKFVGGNTGQNSSNDKVYSAWARTKSQLFNDNFVPWKFHKKNSTWEPSVHEGIQVSKIVVTQNTPDATDKPNYDQMNETYTLEIPSANGGLNSSSLSPGTIYINAESSLGVLHGLTTLSQLFYAHSTAADCVYSPYAPVSINDAPKYVHRGLNWDVSRQWYPKETILRTLDALSWNKFNRLHLHATDAQSWPLEIPSMPTLAKNGAYRPDLTYSPSDLQEILDYAFERGIQVYIETDMPGHTTSIADAFPELIVGRNVQPDWDNVAAQPPSGSMKLNDPAVTDFVTKLLNDLQPRLRAHTNYYHTGGDEVKANIYLLEDGVNSNATDVLTPLLQKFINHAHEVTHANKMTPVVWEEMFGEWHLNLTKDVIIQAWQSDEIVKNITKAGYKAIGGNFDYWYLDCGNGQWLDFGNNVFSKYFPFNDYCSPKKNWRLVYSYDPAQGLNEEEAKLVLGGEVHIWSEQIDSENLDTLLWPRGSAAAEVMWSGRTDAHGVNRTFADASPRLAEMRERMVNRGYKMQPITQLWCLQNPGDCQLNH